MPAIRPNDVLPQPAQPKKRRDRNADPLPGDDLFPLTWGTVVVSTGMLIAFFALLCWALTP